MILIDTSIWIEFFRGNPDYTSEIILLLEEKKVLGLSCIFGELLQGAKDKKEQKILLDYWKCIRSEDQSGLFIKAGILSGQNKWTSKGVGLIDAAIVCSALYSNAQVWTLDKKLAALLPAHSLFQST